jgi:hypothetical protein
MSIFAKIIAHVVTLFDPEIRKMRRETKELKRFSGMIDRANEDGERFLESGKDTMVFGPSEKNFYYGEVPPPKKEDFKM